MTLVEERSAPLEVAVPGDATRERQTVLPRIEAMPVPPHGLRRLAGWSRQDLMTILGAALSALCTTRLLFGILTPLSGPLGFTFVAFALFNAAYAFLVSLTENRPIVVDKVMSVLMASCAAISVGALASVVTYTLWEGRVALGKANLFTEDMSTTGPLDPLTQGGIAHAIVGSLLIMAVCLVLTVPARHRRRGVPHRDREPGDAARAHRGRRHDRAALHRRRPLHLRHLHPHPGLRTLRAGRVAGGQHHDAADHHPLGRRRASLGAGQSPRGGRRAGRASLADRPVRRPPDRALRAWRRP